MVTAFAAKVKLAEGYVDMGAFSKLARSAKSIFRGKGSSGGFGGLGLRGLMAKNPELAQKLKGAGGAKTITTSSNPKATINEARERVGVKALSKGGKVKKGYHRMPNGKIMKDSAHKKTAKRSTASSRGDGICRKGKTRGKIC